jgi:Nucleotide-diphospho-sugar transferase
MNYIIVAYYTENTGYEEEVKNLRASLEKFYLPMDIVGIPSQGDWQANTQYKPYFIKQMLLRHYPKNIVYLDADARVQQMPTLFESISSDVGVFYLDDQELVSSTLYFANNAKAFEVIERWIAHCFEHPEVWDQKILQYVLQESTDLKLHIKYLPPNYCQIFDLMKDYGAPIIEQCQASRRLKNKS